MAVNDIWESKETLIIEYSGIVSGPDIIDASLKTSGDERFDDIRAIIADWTHIRRVDLSPDEVKSLVACLRAVSKTNPYAKNISVVDPKDDTGQALVAWYKFLADDLSWDICVCSSMQEARVIASNRPVSKKNLFAGPQ